MESLTTRRAKRGLPLKGKWDGIVAKYRAAATERDELQKYADEAYAYRDEFTKRYLSISDPQRRGYKTYGKHKTEETKPLVEKHEQG